MARARARRWRWRPAAKARALIHGRPNASFEDVKAVAPPVLRHRILLDYQARVEGRTSNDVVSALLAEIPTSADALPRTLHAMPLEEDPAVSVTSPI